MDKKENPQGIGEHLKTLEKSGIYNTETVNGEQVMIYFVKGATSRVVFFKNDHTVLEVLFDKDAEPVAIRDGGTWVMEERGDSWEPTDEFVEKEEEEK